MKKIINRLINYETLSKDEAKKIIKNIADGKYNPSQISSFLTIFMMRNIKLEELEGFREALLELCVKINLSEFDTIDLCGTGGDNKNTFNISTLASFVTAGAGIHVTKHGNYSVSSACGSSNLLEYFGIKFSNDFNFLNDCLDKANMNNIAFDDKFSHIADFDLIIRLSSKYKLFYLNEILSGWRVHNDSLTWKEQDKFYYELIKWTNYYMDHDFFKNYKKSIIKLKNKSILNLISEKIISFEFNESLNLIRQEKKRFIYFLPHIILNILKRILSILFFKRKWT